MELWSAYMQSQMRYCVKQFHIKWLYYRNKVVNMVSNNYAVEITEKYMLRI